MKTARDLLAEYGSATKLLRALKRRKHADEFAEISKQLNEGVLALQLDVSVAGWTGEDERDVVEDLERILEIMENMEFERRGNHQEVMTALQVHTIIRLRLEHCRGQLCVRYHPWVWLVRARSHEFDLPI